MLGEINGYYYAIIAFLNLQCSEIFKCEHFSNLERKLMRNCEFFIFIFCSRILFHFLYLFNCQTQQACYKQVFTFVWDITVEQGDLPNFLTSTHYNSTLHRTQHCPPRLWNKPRITRKTRQLVMNPCFKFDPKISRHLQVLTSSLKSRVKY